MVVIPHYSTRSRKVIENKEDKRLTYEVPEAGKMLGLGRCASYEAAKRGDIPTIRIGKLLRVPKTQFHAKFGGSGSK